MRAPDTMSGLGAENVCTAKARDHESNELAAASVRWLGSAPASHVRCTAFWLRQNGSNKAPGGETCRGLCIFGAMQVVGW